jgi:hypothetical protein
MNEPHLGRVESKKVERASRIFLICGIGSLIILVIKICLQTRSYDSAGFWFDVGLAVVLSAYLLSQRQKLLNDRKDQFIEWSADKVVFKVQPNVAVI